MKSKLIISVFALLSAASLFAVPAYRGWQTKTQPDGTTIEVQLNGDEFYHFYTNRAGQVVTCDEQGYWTIVEQQPSSATISARRKASPMMQTRPHRVGKINLAPRGLFILVNFKDTQFRSSNTQEEMNKMMNADTYTYNGAYGSARKYFIDQSHGAYVPTFDVVGPVTLSEDCSYYGKNVGGEDGNDMYPGDMVIEACKLADTQFGVDFTKYDNDHDGYVDFVYIIYAGKGEADGGAASTIWPHNWNIGSTIYYGNCTYKEEDCKVDGLYIDDYACSGELNGHDGSRNGIGTLCHEFSHVLGLPDYYDTEYGSNSKNARTPDDWDIMASGSYNGDGNYPPNYSAHEKYFFGWNTPTNLGNTPAALTLNANGTSGYNSYQLNTANTLQSATQEGINYYIENRQQSGWDTYLPGHGLLVWYVNYNADAWSQNVPNNTAGSPRYTVISASGNKTDLGTAKDPFPGTNNIKTTTIAGKPLSNITETNGAVSLIYVKDPNSDEWNYEVAYEHCTVSSESGTVKRGETLTVTVMTDNGYVISSAENIEVTMGSKTLAYNIDFTCTPVTANTYTLTIPAVTGDVEIYIMPATAPAKAYTVQWVADGEVIETEYYDANETLRLPTTSVIACEGMTFIGWTKTKNFYDPFALPSDLITAAGQQSTAGVQSSAVTPQARDKETTSHAQALEIKVTSNLTFYAVYK